LRAKQKLPAHKTGGFYKTDGPQDGIVEAISSRVLRGEKGRFVIDQRLEHASLLEFDSPPA